MRRRRRGYLRNSLAFARVVGKRYFFVILSTVINIAAIVLLLTRGLNYGVDFAGGSIAQIEGDTAQFVLADASSPALVRDTADVGALYVIMPMRV